MSWSICLRPFEYMCVNVRVGAYICRRERVCTRVHARACVYKHIYILNHYHCLF